MYFQLLGQTVKRTGVKLIAHGRNPANSRFTEKLITEHIVVDDNIALQFKAFIINDDV